MKNEIRWPWLRLSTTTDSWPASLPRAADLYDDQNLPPSTSLRDLLPGLLITLLGVLSAMYLSDQYGIPTTLIGLLIGLSLNFLAGHGALARGLSFASSSFLRLGIVLAGTNITIAQVVALGAPALASVAVIITIVIMSGIIFARLVGYDRAFGVLAAGAVAICGASAALALAAILDRRLPDRTSLTLVLVGISALSALSMFLYPVIGHELGMTDRQAGFFLGASIHDVAQAIGAGFSFSEKAGQTAAIVKLTRVAFLAPVLIIVGLLMTERTGPTMRLSDMPWFVLAFAVMVCINSTGWISPAIGHGLSSLGRTLILAAIIAAAIRSPVGQILNHGPRSLLVLAGASVVSAIVSILFAMILL